MRERAQGISGGNGPFTRAQFAGVAQSGSRKVRARNFHYGNVSEVIGANKLASECLSDICRAPANCARVNGPLPPEIPWARSLIPSPSA